eukprot:1158329-Pelagomonas_calceolata.AAC.19
MASLFIFIPTDEQLLAAPLALDPWQTPRFRSLNLRFCAESHTVLYGLNNDPPAFSPHPRFSAALVRPSGVTQALMY